MMLQFEVFEKHGRVTKMNSKQAWIDWLVFEVIMWKFEY